MQVLAKEVMPEAYLEFERSSEQRYEFVNGELVKRDMPKIIHEIIVGNLIVMLSMALKGKPYRALSSGVKIDIDRVGNYGYADVSVVPTENLDFESDVLNNVVCLCEISSKSTMNVAKVRSLRNTKRLHRSRIM